MRLEERTSGVEDLELIIHTYRHDLNGCPETEIYTSSCNPNLRFSSAKACSLALISAFATADACCFDGWWYRTVCQPMILVQGEP
jgi:hypothetical protein